MDVDTTNVSGSQKWEEDLQWQYEKKFVEYMGWRGGHRSETSEKRLKEIDDTISTLQRIKETCTADKQVEEEKQEGDEDREEENEDKHWEEEN